MFTYFQLVRAANNGYFCLFYFDFTSYNFASFTLSDGEFFTVRSTMELHIAHRFLKGSVLIVF